ncbi:hydantoinase/oxoprolinase family protein [Candidatus Poribacteria bacterium]|nr:hydantoinase/oxoprolinase family protein [Candidatus Poribacteria bacterium]
MNLGLGVDTGGTYTDSVIINFDSGQVLAKAKALTTRQDLSIGIANSIDNLGKLYPHDIKLVSVSTTLATNSIVEGKGARACLLGIGYDEKTLYKYGFGTDFPIRDIRLVNGGHEISGREIMPLDIDDLKKAILETREIVDAYGVSAYGGVRNPKHEIIASKMIKDLTNLPVVCGHELTSRLNSIKRAITAAFNARLIPVIKELIDAIKKALEERNISAPLMVVKGDGHFVSDKVAMERPIETILSGPAASIMGVKFLSGTETGVVADMGGTTTDIAILRNGIPQINMDGASVGKWRTSVRAADIQTSGLGGDSHITIDKWNRITLNPQRVIPLSLAASEHAEIINELRELRDAEWRSNMLPPTDFFIRVKFANNGFLDENERMICSELNNGPLSARLLSKRLKLLHPALLNTGRLEEMGIISRIGLTPTDILHAEGTYRIWNTEAAEIAVKIYASHANIKKVDCISQVKKKVKEKLSTEILSKFLSEELDNSDFYNCKTCTLFIEKMMGRNLIPEIKFDISVRLPIIAIGAPVQAYFPQVAEILKAQLIIPEHAEVANAVGAITGNIIETVEILIEPVYTAAGIAGYTVHTPEEKTDFLRLNEAKSYAEKTALEIAKENAIRAGAGESLEIKIEAADQKATAAEGHDQKGKDLLLSSVVKAVAIGKPDIFGSM